MYPGPWQGVQTGVSTKSAKFRWIIGAGTGVVEICGVDMYVGRVLKCRGSVSLDRSVLYPGHINIKNHV